MTDSQTAFLIVFAPLATYLFLSYRADKTDAGMYTAYKQFSREAGRPINTPHKTEKQRVARVRRIHRNIDERMIARFGQERVQKFYSENNVIQKRQRDIDYVKKMNL